MDGLTIVHLNSSRCEDQTMSTVVGTRLHWQNHSRAQSIDVEALLERVAAFCTRAAAYADAIVLAIGLPSETVEINEDDAKSLFVKSVQAFMKIFQQRIQQESIIAPSSLGNRRCIPIVLVPMLHWGSFVPALNAIISASASKFPDAALLLLQSLEIEIDASSVDHLKQQFVLGSDLVVGAALPGHAFQPPADGAALELTGATTPWNTLALWDLTQLAKIGFPLIGDGLKIPASVAGVEEVSAIALYQRVFPNMSRAKVVCVPGVDWHVTTFDDDERRQWQQKKMASKLQRPATQMEHFGIPSGSVHHIA